MFRILLTALSLTLGTSFAKSNELYLQESAGTPMYLAPSETKVIGNAFTCTMRIECDTTCQDNVTNVIHFTILNKGGSLNGIPVTKGDSMDVDINTGDKLTIIAKPASRVELKNIGSTKISSMCNITCK